VLQTRYKSRLVATIAVLLLASCTGDGVHQTNEPTNRPEITLKSGRVLTGVDIRGGESNTLFLNYRTTIPVDTCEIQVEVREIWLMVLKSEAEKRQVRRASIIPEDTEHRGRGFSYVRDKDGNYVESNFLSCR
jgi:hypothetical protein